MKEIIEFIAVQARNSEYIDQKSGVSPRLPITCMENLISNVERRNIILNEHDCCPRVCDLEAVVPSVVGKIELVYEGEQEGAVNVARFLIGQAVKEVFTRYFPKVYTKKSNFGLLKAIHWIYLMIYQPIHISVYWNQLQT